jgi:competence protein ComEA
MPDVSRDEPVSRRLRHVVAPGVDELEIDPSDGRMVVHPVAGRAAGEPSEEWVAGEPGEEWVAGEPGGEWVARDSGGGWAAGDAIAGPAADAPEPGSAHLPGRSVSGRLPGANPFDPGRRGVRALAMVAVIVVVAAAYLAWRARPLPEPVPDVVVPDVAVSAQASVGAEPQPEPAGSSATGPAGELVVAVAGKVRRPGLVRLPVGARVADALEACGGLQPGAEVSFLNLARKVTDGELILVGVTPPPGMPGAGAGGAAGGGAPPGGAAGPAEPGGPVNLNTATLTELDTLPGVGPVLAQRIVDHRERHGAFRAVDDLRQVDGIGETRFEQLKALVTV